MEICVDSLQSARNAIQGGAMRLEVCSALSEGGLTPSPGLIKQIRSFTRVPIYAMIRIRKGNFVYDREEIEAMLYDLRILKDHCVNGFVFGALTTNNDVDCDVCKEIISAARPLPVTFHRAFDETLEPSRSMEVLIDLGFERILTSGQKNTALEGLELLKELVVGAKNRIIIMPGAGITKNNISKIKQCGAREFHASAKRRIQMINGPNGIRFGDGKDNFIDMTDAELVKELINIVNK